MEQASNATSYDVRDVFEKVSGSFWRYATHKHGCRIIQDILEILPPGDAAHLLENLRGSVRFAMDSPHANHV